jgi:cytochrome c biogenesis protein CcmG/thiol:disulfide interchange protein DsbE
MSLNRALAQIALAVVWMVQPANVPAAGRDSLQLSRYQGKVVLLNFWATTCGGCQIEIPWFMEFQARYQRRGLVVIGVSMDDDGWKSVKPFVREKKINYRIVLGNEELARRYGGVAALPMTLLIDRAGRIAASRTGLVDKEAWENQIRTLLR